jgi:hypothetical protein
MQPNEFADLVVMTVKNAIAPFSERVARVESEQARAAVTERTLAELRDRMFAVENKAHPQLPDIAALVAAAVAPAMERLAAGMARVDSFAANEKNLTELRDRLVTLETEHRMPPPPDPAIGELRERFAVFETKAAQPAVPGVVEMRTDDTRDRVLALETKAAQPLALETVVSDLRGSFERIEKRLHEEASANTALRERIAVLETRAPVPGPAGKDGADGRDGMGVEDFIAEHDGERNITLKYARGERVKTAGTFKIPAMIYRGVYSEGRPYEPGDTVTWGGHLWHCDKATTLKPDAVAPINQGEKGVEFRGQNGKDYWTLVVRKGDTGKQGPQGPSGVLPVVSVGAK